jgi:hypothetical protein
MNIADDPSGAPPMEYLDGRTPSAQPPKRRKPRWWAPIVAAVLVFFVTFAAVGLVAGDWVSRTLEDRTLITQIESSEQAMTTTQDAVEAAIADFQGKTSPTQDDQTALTDALMAAAATGHDAVAASGDQIAAVKVLPWHKDILAAQKAYLAHNKAWQDYLGAASADAQEFGKSHDEVNSTFAAAEKPLRAAVPKPDALKLADRIDTIYAPQPTTGGQGGPQA